MKKTILFIILLIAAGSLSCYDGLIDTYHVYKLRDIGPGGGWIFYINPNYKKDGWKYMEAAPVEQSTSTFQWSTNTSISVPGANESRVIGTGLQNTDAIIAQPGQGGPSAASICRDYNGGGKTDWFLPSYEEYLQIYYNLYLYGIGGFSIGNDYWSSTESNATGAYAFSFYPVFTFGQVPKNYSGSGSNHDPNPIYVRAARRF